MSLSAAFSGLVDFLYPKSDLVYDLESLSPSELLRRLPPAPEADSATLALFAYADPSVRELIWELKYRKNMKVAQTLASLLLDVLRTELAERALSENFRNPLLLPIPISTKRLAERGWNQTEVLCDELQKLNLSNDFEYRKDLLKRVRHSQSQTKVSKAERLLNVEGSMQASAEVGGRCVILIDDVTTTGATFAEAKRELRRSGALKILCVALAH